jgi:hypothetical protein
LKPEDVPLVITGSQKCSTCHSLKNLGSQQKVWEESKHSKAYLTLLSDKAKSFANSKGIKSPEENELCLKCHTTKGFLGLNEIDAAYDKKEGVGCEACHGAGSKYSPAEIMKDEDLFINNGGVKGSEETCLGCHSKKAGKQNGEISENICPFQEKDFNFKSYMEKVVHPVNKEYMK